MEEHRAVVKDHSLAKEMVDLTDKYDKELCALLDKLREIEKQEDFKQTAYAVGHVLAAHGMYLMFPIYRQHNDLTPPSLKDSIIKPQPPAAG